MPLASASSAKLSILLDEGLHRTKLVEYVQIPEESLCGQLMDKFYALVLCHPVASTHEAISAPSHECGRHDLTMVRGGVVTKALNCVKA